MNEAVGTNVVDVSCDSRSGCSSSRSCSSVDLVYRPEPPPRHKRRSRLILPEKLVRQMFVIGFA